MLEINGWLKIYIRQIDWINETVGHLSNLQLNIIVLTYGNKTYCFVVVSLCGLAALF
jgi:hypothetical protein